MENRNVGLIDRSVRFVVGILLMTWAIAGGPYWTWLGIIPLATSSWAICPVYKVLGVSSCKSPDQAGR